MALSYAGVPLVVPTAEASSWIESRISTADLFPFSEPLLNQQRVPVTIPGNAIRRGVKVGTLYWPTGASRWAVAYMLASSDQLAPIRSQVYGGGYNPQPLIMGDGTNQIIVNLWLLAARPLDQIPGQTGMWLLTLVDRRYWWWFKSTGAVSSLSNYGAAYQTLGAALGVSVTADPISSNYAFPTALSAQYESPAPLLDQIAFNCGQRIVVGLDGSVKAQSPVTSRQQITKTLDSGLNVLAGGTLNLYPPSATEAPSVLPGTVLMTFPKVQDGTLTSTLVTLSATLTSLGLSDLPQTRSNPAATQLVNSPVQASYSSATWSNQTALQNHLNQWAGDYYRWQTADVDYTFTGVAPWVPEGLSDSIEWTYLRERVVTRVQRPPLNLQSPAAAAVTNTSGGGGSGGGGLSLNVNIFTSSGTWTKPANLVFAEMEVVGGGGAGGYAVATSSTQYAVGGGGGAGGYAYRKLNAASLGATETVTVGAAGTSTSSASTGGSNSSFGSWASATGGGAGGSMPGGTPASAGMDFVAGGTGGVGSSGDLNAQGSAGVSGLILYDSGTGTYVIYPGRGGVSLWGGVPDSITTGAAALAGYGVGGGGEGSHNSGARAAGNGMPGIVIIYEWTSSGSGGGSTATNGTASLGSDYTLTTGLANSGLSVTLPAAGTYLLIATVTSAMTGSVTSGDRTFGRLYDSTAAVAVTPTTVLSFCFNNTPCQNTTSIHAIYTAPAANTVINLQGEYNPAGPGPATYLFDTSGDQTNLSYVRLS